MPVMSVEEFGKWLGKETGELAIVSPEVAERDIYVNVRQRTLAEVEVYVARAADLVYLRKNGSITILPAAVGADDRKFEWFDGEVAKISSNKIDEDSIKYALSRIKENALEIQSFVNSAGGKAKQDLLHLSNLVDEQKHLFSFDPAKRLISEAVHGIGIDGLKALPLYERTVYSTSPSRLQLAWPVPIKGTLSWINELCDFKNSLVESDHYFDQVRGSSEMRWTDLLSTYGGKEKPITNMQMSISPELDRINIEIRLFDESGSLAKSSSHTIYFTESKNDLKALPIITPELAKPWDDEIEVQWMDTLYGYPPVLNLSGKNLYRLSQLGLGNPFDEKVSDLYDFVTNYCGGELVTEVQWIREDFTKKEFAERIARRYFGDVKRYQGVVVDPTFESRRMRESCVPLGAVSRLAKRSIGQSGVSLDNLADEVSKLQFHGQVEQLINVYLPLGGQGDYSSYVERTGFDQLAVELYARLNRAQRMAVFSENGFTLPLANQSQAVQSLLFDFFRSSNFDLNPMPACYSDEKIGLFEGELSDWETEQTVFLADPRFQQISLTLKGITRIGYIEKEVGSDDDEFQFRTVLGLADKRYFIERGRLDGETDLSAYLYGQSSMQVLECRLNIGPLKIGGGGFAMLGRRTGELVSFERLPQAVRKTVLEEVRQLLERDGL